MVQGFPCIFLARASENTKTAAKLLAASFSFDGGFGALCAVHREIHCGIHSDPHGVCVCSLEKDIRSVRNANGMKPHRMVYLYHRNTQNRSFSSPSFCDKYLCIYFAFTGKFRSVGAATPLHRMRIFSINFEHLKRK